MSNSSLVQYVLISPNSTNPRKKPITKITIHHMAGKLSVETCGRIFQPTSRRASSNYAVGIDGRIGMYVEEKNRAWTSSSSANDDSAVTIEVANDVVGGNWHVSDLCLERTIELCVDICKRNNIKELKYTGDKNGSLTRHNMFAATSCPGPYLQSKFPYIADEVNRRLKDASKSVKALYRVRVSWDDEKSQLGAFSKLDNAKALVDKNKGYFVYDESGKVVYPIIKELAVGNIVMFKGTTHYSNANADRGFTVRPGVAKITQIYKNGRHPYHVVSVDSSSNVHGWVNKEDITDVNVPVAKKKVIKVGDKVKVNKPVAYDGKSLRLYYQTYDVLEIKSDRVVIGKGKTVTAAVNKDNLTVV